MLKVTTQTETIIAQWCIQHLAPIEPLPKYCPKWEVFKQQREQGIVRVFAHGAAVENMIFNSHSFRWYYRAWHDSLHLKHNLPFGGENELSLAEIQEVEAIALGCDPWDAYLLNCDLYCHIRHYDEHGRHPEYQALLVQDYLRFGDAAFKQDYSLEGQMPLGGK